MSGYTNGALSYSGQHNSIPYLFNQQLTSVGINTTFNQHFISLPNGLGVNFPNTNPRYLTSLHLGNFTDCLGVTSLFPLNDSIPSNSSALYNELTYNQQFAQYSVEAVPFATIPEYTETAMGVEFGMNPYYPPIASGQGFSTMLSDALAQQFTFFILWAGMEDVYQYAQNGGQIDSLTDFGAFDTDFEYILDNLISIPQGPHGILANIPDIDVFPFFTYVPWNGLVLTQAEADGLNMLPFIKKFTTGANGFVIYDSTLSSTGFPYRQTNSDEYVLLNVPSDSIKCSGVGSIHPLSAVNILTANQVANINAAIQHFNGKIASAAQAHNIPMVDMNSFFRTIKNGYYYDGIKFSSTFITGAFYSLDGFHPTGQGYGLLTNEFIKTINGFYHSTIPLVDITKLPGVVFP